MTGKLWALHQLMAVPRARLGLGSKSGRPGSDGQLVNLSLLLYVQLPR